MCVLGPAGPEQVEQVYHPVGRSLEPPEPTDLAHLTDPEQADQRCQTQAIRLQELEPEAVETEVRAAIEQVGVVAQIG